MANTDKTQSLKYTSSKADIWKAYKDAVDLLGQPNATDKERTTALKQISISNTKLKDQLTTLKATISTKIDEECAVVLEQITQAYQMLNLLRQTSQDLRQEQEAIKNTQKREREREQEEYNYEFSKRKQRQEEELAESRQKVETELKAQRDEFKEQQTELESLRKQVAQFDKQLETEINKSVSAENKRLASEFSHKQELAEIQYASKLTLVEQKATSMQEVIKTQQEEIRRLQTALDSANKQVTSIAEKAVSQPSHPNMRHTAEDAD